MIWLRSEGNEDHMLNEWDEEFYVFEMKIVIDFKNKDEENDILLW